jgi:hypothetical protein
MSLTDTIRELERLRGDAPLPPIEDWQRGVGPSECVIFAWTPPGAVKTMPLFGYAVVEAPPEAVPDGYVYVRASMHPFIEDQPTVIHRSSIVYVITSERFNAARAAGFPSDPLRASLFAGFTSGGSS